LRRIYIALGYKYSAPTGHFSKTCSFLLQEKDRRRIFSKTSPQSSPEGEEVVSARIGISNASEEPINEKITHLV